MPTCRYRSSASVCPRQPHNGCRRRATACLLPCPVARARQRLHPWSAASLPAPPASQRLSPSCYVLLAFMPRSASAAALASVVGSVPASPADLTTAVAVVLHLAHRACTPHSSPRPWRLALRQDPASKVHLQHRASGVRIVFELRLRAYQSYRCYGLLCALAPL